MPRSTHRLGSRRPLVLPIAIAALLAVVPSAADAAVQSKLDRYAGVRLTLDGPRLTARLLAPPVRGTGGPEDQLFGRRIRGVCGTTFRFGSARPVVDLRDWPAGARSLAFAFPRDVSRRAKWCLIEGTGPDGGGDIAMVSFVRGEHYRTVAAGDSPSGQRWRLRARRGDRLQPCVELRVDDDRSGQCLDDEAERESGLAAVALVPACPGDTYVFGATPRVTARVSVVLADGTAVDAALHRRPAGSRVRASYFIAVLPGIAAVRAVAAHDAAGEVIGRERYPRDTFDEPCGVLVPH